MRPLSAPELLEAWERALPLSTPERSLALLAAAAQEIAPDALARLSIGQRDARLLTLREWTFGARMTSLASCPACAQRLELAFNVADLRVVPEVTHDVETFSLVADGYEAVFRLPNTLDMLAIASCTGVDEARARLLERCLTWARHGEHKVAAMELPPEVVAAVAAHMAAADPQADAQLALDCPRCAHRWLAAFDIAAFFWDEVHAWARRMLGEVHALARTYGWREHDILNMSAWRRQFYLGMAGGQANVPGEKG